MLDGRLTTYSVQWECRDKRDLCMWIVKAIKTKNYYITAMFYGFKEKYTPQNLKKNMGEPH